MSTTPPQIPAARKGFIASLLDPSFSTLVTTRVIRFLYILLLVLIGLGLLVFLIASIASGDGVQIVLALVLGPLLALLYIIYARVILEVILAIFRLLESSREIAFLQRQTLEQLQGQAPPQAAVPPAPPAA